MSAISSPLLQADSIGLSAKVGNGWILQHISFAIAAGEFLGIVGPSGAGKTSLLRLLNRLQDPNVGDLRFRHAPLESYPVIALRQQIMLVGQDTRLLGMTVEAALRYSLQLQNIPTSAQDDRIRPWLARLTIPTEWLGRSALELSGGQQQRVAIARALIAQPTVLLLDEPTSAQDLGTAHQILAAIRAEMQHRGLTVIMTNHQLELVAEFCDRVLYLEQGHIKLEGAAHAVPWDDIRDRILAAKQQDVAEWGEA